MSNQGSIGNRSASATPVSSGGSTPTKRRRIDAINELLAYSAQNPQGVVTTQDIQRIALEAGLLSPETRSLRNTVTIQASSLTDLDSTLEILQLDWNADEQHLWSFPPGSSDPSVVKLTQDAEDLSYRMRTAASWWGYSTCEAMSRTLRDIVLFDILSQNSNALISKQMKLVREHRVVTKEPEGGFIVGTADYVLGFKTQVSSQTYYYRGISVIIEAKKYPNMSAAMAQAIAYMLGCQQNRLTSEPNLRSDTTYGIISDSLKWQFLKLEGSELSMSGVLTMMDEQDRHRVYGFLDFIVKSAIAMSPQNSPQNFPPAPAQGSPPPDSPTPVRTSGASLLDVFNA